MAKESLSPQTIAKGVGAAAILAASLGALQFQDYQKSLYVPGTYSASAHGMESDVVVTITVDGTTIQDVTVDVSGETQGIGAAIGDEVISQIKAAQSTAIDGVAGATVTSTAVQEALAEALSKAAVGDTSAVETASSDNTGEEEQGAESVTEGAAESQEAVTEGAADTAETVSGSYTPGTYSASAQGMESDVAVEITFDENGATDVSVDVSGETAGIGAEIGDEMVQQLLDAQSPDVEGVASATITSTAIRTAAEEIYAQAAAETASGSYTPGTYSASAQGMESDVAVEITFDENGATDVSVDVSGETAGIGAEIGDEMVQQLLDAQSPDVEGVASATITSTAIRTAAEEIYAQAAAGGADDAAVEAVTEGAEDNSGEQSGELTADGRFYIGTYTASAAGKESDVTVEITIDADGISSISVDVSGETKGIGAEVGDRLAERIQDAQSADFDSITGATVTSEAAQAAAAEIFNLAAAETDAAEEAVTEGTDLEVISSSEIGEIPAGYGVAVLEGSDESYDISDFEENASAAADILTEADTEAVTDAEEEAGPAEEAPAAEETEPVEIDENKAGVGVAEL